MQESIKKRLEYLDSNFYNLKDHELNFLDLYINSVINKKDLSVLEKKLIMKYAVRKKCFYYGYPIIQCEFKSDNVDRAGYYSSDYNKIFFNSLFLDKIPVNYSSYPFYYGDASELEVLLKLANHECEHFFQNYDLKSGKITKGSFAFLIRDILNDYIPKYSNGDNEYHKNYAFKEIENYANIKGWYDTIMFMASTKTSDHGYDFDNISKFWLQSSARQNISYQVSPDGKKKIIEDYNISQLCNIVQKYPNNIKRYPILNTFFYGEKSGDKYGKLKDLNLLLFQYQELEKEYGKTKSRAEVEEEQFVYRQFFYYILKNDASMVPIHYKDVIYDLIINDLFSIQGLFDIKDKSTYGDSYKHVFKIKMDRICVLINKLLQFNEFGNYYEKIRSEMLETLTVYETSKRMYNDLNPDVENYMNYLRDKFNINDVEFRNPEGRKSAINI